jgi:hypothetical protein
MGAALVCASAGTSVFSASCSASRVITMMLMRRLTGFRGFCLSNSTDEESPTTRETLSAFNPACSSARRAALARSVERSQFV